MALSAIPPIATLHLATLELPNWHPEAAGDGVCHVYGYAIDHPDGLILFDTGVGFGNEFINEAYRPDARRIDDELRRGGFTPDSVAAVVNSHLHFDHCGQNPSFYGADIPVFVQQAEVDNVTRDPRYTDASWALAPEAQRRAIDSIRRIKSLRPSVVYFSHCSEYRRQSLS